MRYAFLLAFVHRLLLRQTGGALYFKRTVVAGVLEHALLFDMNNFIDDRLLTLWVCKLLMLICILTKNVITSCSVTMMLFLHLEVKPLMTLTTVLYLSCA